MVLPVTVLLHNESRGGAAVRWDIQSACRGLGRDETRRMKCTEEWEEKAAQPLAHDSNTRQKDEHTLARGPCGFRIAQSGVEQNTMLPLGVSEE